MEHSRYTGFISYSHADLAVARWLQRALEAYRPPPSVARNRSDLAGGGRFFRDAEDLTASGSLSDSVDAALASSEFLIVICSPDAVASRWVNEEIRRFKARAGSERVLPLIVDGEPFSDDPARECFPAALKETIDSGGAVVDNALEPLAANLRIDGRRRAKLKLVAAMLGVPLDSLLRREHQRQLRTLAAVTAASLLGLLLTSALAWTAISARQASEFQRAEAEGLIEFMLTDLRARLEPVGRLDALSAVGSEALGYYERISPDELDDESLARSMRALLLLAEIEEQRGNLDVAEQAFERVHAATAELLEREPGAPQRIFDHAQSAYWRGYAAWERDDFERARQYFEDYLALAEQLVAIDDHEPTWLAEVAYAHSNLGTLLHSQRRLVEAEAAFRASLSEFERVAALEPTETGWKYELAQSHAWLAAVLRGKRDLAGALAMREREARLYEALLTLEPGDSGTRYALAISKTALGDVELALGRIQRAREHFDAARIAFDDLMRLDDSNVHWQRGLCQVLLLELPINEQDVRMQTAERVLAITNDAQARGRATADLLDQRSEAEIILSEALVRDARLAKLELLVMKLDASDESVDRGVLKRGLLRALRERARLLDDREHWRALGARLEARGTRTVLEDLLLLEALLVQGRRQEAGALLRGFERVGFAHPELRELLARRASAEALARFDR